jgi:hypothetical protein
MKARGEGRQYGSGSSLRGIFADLRKREMFTSGSIGRKSEHANFGAKINRDDSAKSHVEPLFSSKQYHPPLNLWKGHCFDFVIESVSNLVVQ